MPYQQYTTTPLTAARAYAEMGYAVLPLTPGQKQPLGRLVPHGLRDASTDTARLEAWWRAVPEAGLGLLPPPTVLVLDLDRGEVWGEMKSRWPELEGAPRQKTPTKGGYHVFLRLPAGLEGALTTTNRKLPGLDLKGLGKGYLVAAPTRLETGSYVWERPLVNPEGLPEAPEGLLRELLPPPPPPKPERVTFQGVGRPSASQARVAALLRWGCDRVASTPPGARHVSLLTLARLMGGYCHLGLDPGAAIEALAQAGMAAGLPEHEARSTARDGVLYGQRDPLELEERAEMFRSGSGFRSGGVLLNISPSLSQKPDLGAVEFRNGGKPRLGVAKPKLGGW